MKKILICNSTHFLMANLIRYMSYRTKEYEFISVDPLDDKENYKMIYINKNNKFYIGSMTNEKFVDRLIYIEKPDIIVNGISSNYTHFLEHPILMDEYYSHLSSIVLSKYNIPILQLTHPKEKNSYYDNLCKITFDNKGSILEIPNCFGIRQNTKDGVAKIIKDIVNYNCSPGCFIPTVEVSLKKVKWSYAEDIASFIWFLIEQDFFGEEGKTLKMPHVGVFSTKDIADVVKNILKKEVEYKTIEMKNYFVEKYYEEKFIGWNPDSFDLNTNLIKTINWYLTNRWMFN